MSDGEFVRGLLLVSRIVSFRGVGMGRVVLEFGLVVLRRRFGFW